MEDLLDFFAHVPTWFRATILVGGMTIFWVMENTTPLFEYKYNKVKHGGINIFFTVTTMIVGFGMAGLLLMASDWTSEHEFGLLYLIDLPLWLRVLVGILLMDFIGAYFIHWLEHQIKWMWKFHLIHHTDTHVDVTSGLRHHPGETFFRVSFTILAVVIIGAPMGIVMLYQSLSIMFAHFTHANVPFLGGWDKPFSRVFVTPNMHKVHHHYKLPYTNTNYGNIFSFWDRIFGTFVYINNMKEIKFGIDTHMKEEEHSSIKNLLKVPFQSYREPSAPQEKIS